MVQCMLVIVVQYCVILMVHFVTVLCVKADLVVCLALFTFSVMLGREVYFTTGSLMENWNGVKEAPSQKVHVHVQASFYFIVILIHCLVTTCTRK